MGKMESRNRRFNGLIYFITLPLIVILIILNMFFINKNTKVKDDIKSYKDNISKATLDFSNIDNEIKEIEEKIAMINSIDSQISISKANYYKTLKIFEDKVYNKEINYKIAYLTFDDGPYNLTNQFLNILEQNNVRATFFTIGSGKEICFDDRSQACGHMYKLEASAGHTMANHTYSHGIRTGLYNNADSFMYQVQKQEDLIKQKTGITTNIVRFPGGSSTSKQYKQSIINKLREKGYGWVDWTASNGDGGYIKDYDTAMRNLKNSINSDIEVVLFHDYNRITLSILPDAIKYLREQNYVLLPLFYESRMVNK